ncbi:MAG: winged helix-turn-helix domain-containing protein [Acidobacteria bacterium]|nr:winged helix-turn-helix domain-containing protein [Acidobacteriota bacterium]
MTDYRSAFSVVRFGPYEADLAAGQLRKHGLRIKLQDQPFMILSAFLERPGEVVTRDHLRQRLWPEGTFVDFDNSLNAAINKLREALGDSADNPRYVETLPRRGYRFIAPVHSEAHSETVGVRASGNGNGNDAGAVVENRMSPRLRPPAIAETTPAKRAIPAPRASLSSAPAQRRSFVAAVIALFLLVSTAAYLSMKRLSPRTSAASGKAMLAVLPFQNMSGDPSQDYFSDGLTEEMIAQISRLQPEQLGVIARSTAMQYRRSPKGIDQIARELGISPASFREPRDCARLDEQSGSV